MEGENVSTPFEKVVVGDIFNVLIPTGIFTSLESPTSDQMYMMTISKGDHSAAL